MDERQYFRIADLGICLVCCGLDAVAESLLPSFAAFTHQSPEGEPLFTLTVNDKQEPTGQRTLVRRFDTGNGDTSVYTTPQGGYEYIIRDTKGRDCCLMAANSDFTECSCALNGTTAMRSFGLNNAMMMAFAFAASRKDTLLIHASCVLHGGRAYPFIAKSGTGKSTHTNLWMRHIPDTELLNDDNPVIRIIDGKPFAYGSPWSGKDTVLPRHKGPAWGSHPHRTSRSQHHRTPQRRAGIRLTAARLLINEMGQGHLRQHLRHSGARHRNHTHIHTPLPARR